MKNSSAITTVGKKEQEKGAGLLDRYNPPFNSPPVCETIIEWLQKGLNTKTNSTALCFGKKTLSYEQIDKLSNSVANYLHDKGLKKGDRVGLSLERSIEMVICMIGIFKSGAVFVPIDPSYPVDRIDAMIEDTDLNVLITHQIFSDRFARVDSDVVFWEQVEDEINTYSNNAPSVVIDGEDVAYIVFTSGSTGRPKGIEMPHRCLSNVIETQLERPYFKKGARLLQYSSISFDVSFQGIITTFATGGTVYLIKDSERRDPRILLQKINEFNIERLFAPYVALRSLIEVAVTTHSIPASLKEVITAGEQLRVDEAVRSFFSQIPGAILDNQYGASENRMVSAFLLEGDPSKWPDLPSVGKPLKNSSVYILDEDLQPVKEGESGELYLTGRNIAYGYIGREDLTKKAFIKNPFGDESRPFIYKSGDLGSYNHNGCIELLGRSDHQIKIRGHRVEPGEINNVGATFPGVGQCLTHVIHNDVGKAQLVTYFTRKNGIKVDEHEFKSYLSKSLPEYMVPAFNIEIDEIPYTPSGKVDLKSLPKPADQLANARNEKEITYETETETQLARIWSEILGFKSIPRSVSYFDLGGDSLSTVTLFLKIEEQFGKAFPLATLLQAPTLCKLAKVIEGSYERKTDYSKFRSLQVIQEGDKNKVPLFMVHGGAGNVLMFRELAKGLDPNQPVFAFQWSGWDGYRGQNDIMEMAGSYKKELREAWPSGPYHIGGHCIGGIIAIELARLLKADGAEVLDPLLISDAVNKNSKKYRSEEPESSDASLLAFKKMEQELTSRIPGAAMEMPSGNKNGVKKNKVQNSPDLKEKSIYRLFINLAKKMPFYNPVRSGILSVNKWCKTTIENRREIVRPLVIQYSLALKKTIPMQDRLYYSTKSVARASKKHTLTPFEGDVLYLRSSQIYGRHFGLQGWWDDLFLGFGEVCNGDFDAYVIGGDHNEVLHTTHAQKIIKENMLS